MTESVGFRAMGTDVEVLGSVAGGPEGAGEAAGARAAAAIERLEAHWSRFRTDQRAQPAQRRGGCSGGRVARHAGTRRARGRCVADDRGAVRPDASWLRSSAAGYDRSFETTSIPRRSREWAATDTPGGARARMRGHHAWTGWCSAVRLPRWRHDRPRRYREGLRRRPGRRRADGDAGGTVARACWSTSAGISARSAAAPAPSGWIVEVDDPLGDRSYRSAGVGRGRDRHEHPSPSRVDARRARAASPHRPADRLHRPARAWRRSRSWRGRRGAPRCWPRRRSWRDPRRPRQSCVDAGATGLLVTDDGDVQEFDGLAAFRP